MIMRQNRLLYISQKSTIIEHLRKSWKNLHPSVKLNGVDSNETE